MKSKLRSPMNLSAAVLALTLAAGCVQPPVAPEPVKGSGPIDGTWQQFSGTCNGNNEGGSFGTLEISGTEGTFSQTALVDGCVVSLPLTLTYPSQGHLTLMTGKTQCSPTCSGAEQASAGCGISTQPSPWLGTFIVSGKNLAITLSNSGCGNFGNSNDVGSDTEAWGFNQ